MMKSKNSIIIVLAIAALIGGILFQQSNNSSNELPKMSKAIILPNPKPLTGVEFIDHTGNPFTKEQLMGRWSIVFFGFTNCPDICPSTMHLLKQVKQNLSDAGKWGNYQVMMITVDPERDSSELLGKYVPYFDPEFIGLRNNLDATTEFAKQLGILFVSHQKEGQENYEVDHGASIILINPNAEMAGVISAPHKLDEISGDLILLADHFKDDHKVVKETAIATAEKSAPVIDTSIDSTTQKTQQQSLTISSSWIRPAPPNAPAMAAYFDLYNHTDTDIVITDSDSDSFGMTMIHDTVIEDGVAKMLHLDSLTIPANSSVSLKPMAKHMMLMQAEDSLEIGDTIDITLVSESGETFDYSIEVKPQPE